MTHAIGIAPKVVNMAAGQSAADAAYSLNILRTHYTPSQRAMFAARRATLTSTEAGARRRACLNSDTLGKPSILQAAKAAGVARSQVSIAKHVRQTAAPAVTAAVEAGRLTLAATSHTANKGEER